jgi:DNA primase catalytic core
VELKKPTAEQIQMGEKKDVLYEINDGAAKYFAKVLWESESAGEALSYLRGRGLNDQTIKNWMLGWAPDDFHYLENFLAKSFRKDDIVQAGLIIKKDNENSYFDRFRGRIMFPIHNMHGQVVGFTGRLLHEKPNTGKYVNSPETPIYNKSQVIYGLYQAKNAMRKENRCVLVEGNMDVISCHQAGFNQTVASSGTAFTEQQLTVLKRFAENLIFAFDMDAAGTNATRRALELALNMGFNVKIVELKDAKDPDELIKRGIGLWQKALDTASNFVEFFFNQTFKQFDSQSVEDKREIAKQLLPLIIRINDQITKAHFVRKLANGLNVSENVIWDMLSKVTLPKPKIPTDQLGKKKGRLEGLQERVLGLALRLKDKEVLSQFEAADFGPHEKVYTSFRSGTPDASLTSTYDLLEFAAQTDVEEQGLDQKAELENAARELMRLTLRIKMEALGSELKLAEQNKDQELIKRLSSEYVALTNKVSQLKN